MLFFSYSEKKFHVIRETMELVPCFCVSVCFIFTSCDSGETARRSSRSEILPTLIQSKLCRLKAIVSGIVDLSSLPAIVARQPSG